MLERHLVRLALSRALLNAGSRIEISRAIIPMTTNNSTSVNPLGRREVITDPSVRPNPDSAGAPSERCVAAADLPCVPAGDCTSLPGDYHCRKLRIRDRGL